MDVLGKNVAVLVYDLLGLINLSCLNIRMLAYFPVLPNNIWHCYC